MKKAKPLLLPQLDDCPICLEPKLVIPFTCTHGVCSKCRSELRQTTCPLCRKELKKELSRKEVKRIREIQNNDAQERNIDLLQDLLENEEEEDEIIVLQRARQSESVVLQGNEVNIIVMIITTAFSRHGVMSQLPDLTRRTPITFRR